MAVLSGWDARQLIFGDAPPLDLPADFEAMEGAAGHVIVRCRVGDGNYGFQFPLGMSRQLAAQRLEYMAHRRRSMSCSA